MSWADKRQAGESAVAGPGLPRIVATVAVAIAVTRTSIAVTWARASAAVTITRRRVAIAAVGARGSLRAPAG